MGIMGHRMYRYFVYEGRPHLYNDIANNNWSERAIEVPIGIDFLCRCRARGAKRMLEVGNVLSGYEALLKARTEIGPIEVVDKFEMAPNVRNVDIMDVTDKYDAIVSLSTVEHIGQPHYGETRIGDREAPLKAIRHLYNLLQPDGKALITVPFGKLTDVGWLIQFSSDYLALLTEKYKVPPQAVEYHYFKKLDTEIEYSAPRQHWIQCRPEELDSVEFHSPFILANGICVINLHKRTADVPEHEGEPENSAASSRLEYASPVLAGDIYFQPFRKPFGFDRNGWMEPNGEGCVFYGPYLSLSAGSYLFEGKLEIDGEGKFELELIADNGGRIFWRIPLPPRTAAIEYPFRLEEPSDGVEIRLMKRSRGKCRVRVPYLRIRPVQPNAPAH